MAHQLGRTELDKLAPPDRILFWQNRIEFWQKEMVGPPSKMPQERLCFLPAISRESQLESLLY